MRVFILSLFALTALSLTVKADVYQWTDESGKVHYGDSRVSGYDSAEKLEIKDKYLIPSVDTLTANHYTNPEPHRQISIENIELDLDGSEHGKVRIGRVTCGRPIDFYWLEGRVDLGSPDVAALAHQSFETYGYNVVNRLGRDSHSTNLQLIGSIKSLKMNLCPSPDNQKFTQNGTYIKIKWQLRDPIRDKVLFSLVTEGSHNALGDRPIEDGSSKSFQSALEQSALNLMAASEFPANLEPISIESLVSKAGTPISVNLKNGQQDLKFHDEISSLKSSAVIVETEEGHGSGVIIDSEGYILTNSHVIANAEKIKVKVNQRSYAAKLVREEPVRDVALLKTDRPLPKHLGVRISTHKPSDGDDLYVIGTPLSIEHAHSITRGIVSARRKIEGLDFIQTDASVNPGNSGGPVFDQHGELIALTVSGLFTRGGANVGISYLIPINDALTHLNITAANTNIVKSTIVKLISSIENSPAPNAGTSSQPENEQVSAIEEQQVEDLHWLTKLYIWLDSPLLYF